MHLFFGNSTTTHVHFETALSKSKLSMHHAVSCNIKLVSRFQQQDKNGDVRIGGTFRGRPF